MTRFQSRKAPPRGDSLKHRFAIGQTVRMKSQTGMTRKVAELFAVMAMMPVRDGSPQYRIRSDQETHDRVAAEDNLETVETPAV